MPTVFKPKKHTHQNPRMPSPRPQELQHPHISSITDLMEEQNVSKTNSLQKEPPWKYGQPPKEEIIGTFGRLILGNPGNFLETFFWDLIRGNCAFFLNLQFGKLELWEKSTKTRWWFQRFFLFTPTWGRFPFWLIFFKWGWNHQPENQFLNCKEFGEVYIWNCGNSQV